MNITSNVAYKPLCLPLQHMKRNQNPCQPLMRPLQKKKSAVYEYRKKKSAVYEFLKQSGLQLYRVNLTRQVGHIEHSGQSRPPGLDVILPVAEHCRGFNLPKKKKKKYRQVDVCKLCKRKIICY